MAGASETTQRSPVFDAWIQGFAGLFNGVVFGVVFAAATAVALDRLMGTQGFQDVTRLLVGGAFGVFLGTPVGIIGTAKLQERSGRPGLCFAGIAFGLAYLTIVARFVDREPFGKFLVLVAPAVGVSAAVVGYNIRIAMNGWRDEPLVPPHPEQIAAVPAPPTPPPAGADHQGGVLEPPPLPQ